VHMWNFLCSQNFDTRILIRNIQLLQVSYDNYAQPRTIILTLLLGYWLVVVLFNFLHIVLRCKQIKYLSRIAIKKYIKQYLKMFSLTRKPKNDKIISSSKKLTLHYISAPTIQPWQDSTWSLCLCQMLLWQLHPQTNDQKLQ
jgi:hypothetical protein